MARQQLKDEHADAPPVRGLCAASPHQHLRWDVLLGSALGVRALLAHPFGHPHVSQLDEACLHAGRGGAGATHAWSKQASRPATAVCLGLEEGWGRAFVVEEDVFRFDVAIDVAMAVNMADGERQACRIKPDPLLGQDVVPAAPCLRPIGSQLRIRSAFEGTNREGAS